MAAKIVGAFNRIYNIFTPLMKVLLGVLIGFFIVFSLFWGYRRIINPYYTLMIPKFVSDTSNKRIAQDDIIGLKNQSFNLEEKIASANKRLDDLLIFGTIIISLLLGINVSVYVSAERQVEKYFRENFDAHKKKVEDTVKNIEEMAGKMKTELELAETSRKRIENVQPPPINDEHN
jgi:uncharacterized protein YneF (UPF0154 family)